MKKIYLLLIVLLIMPVSVFALNKKVTNLEANVNGTTISYAGTIEDDAYAVMCKLYNSSNEEIDNYSSQVVDNEFNGSFIAPKTGKYNVSCADFDGGDIKSVEVNIEESTVLSDIKSAINPDTNDGIVIYFIIFTVGIIGLISSTIYVFKTRKKLNG